MALTLAWSLFALGIAHVVFGVLRFKEPLLGALADGFVGQFSAHESRRTAFWFLMAGPQLMLAGQVALHAVSHGQPGLLRLIGVYLLVCSAIGVAAFPKSPLPVALVLSVLLLVVPLPQPQMR
ncbi:hypothetical protein HLB44_00920 [Aquincola sp. S2]|uniref:DUF1304 domain-containing protein n=1 Tax=Pseudaquabacterium terrae TaxID=2732868 RepID=A0ABX2EAV9_9BURK|nr:DUF6463 family protein [Aquabacterium terrae]NRF65534.1 hypothetical protein [Aquabacterium terrae]